MKQFLSNKIVELGKQLELEIDNDVEQLVESVAEEPSNEDLIELDAQKIAEEEETKCRRTCTPQKVFRETNGRGICYN